MKTKFVISLAIGLLISAGAMYLALRHVPLRQLSSYLATINYLWMLPSAGVLIAGFYLRALRWRLLLKSACHLPVNQVFHPLMIGFMINCVLPGRLGELARPAIINRQSHVAFATALTTVMTERIFDMALLLGMLAMVLNSVSISPDIYLNFGDHRLDKQLLMTIARGMITVGALAALAMLALSARRVRDGLGKFIMKLPSYCVFLPPHRQKWLQSSACEPVTRMLDHVGKGLAMLNRPGRIAWCLALSAAIWMLGALSYYLMILGCPGVTLNLAQTTAMMVIICFFIALPSVPGFWGIWEAGGMFALALFGIHSTDGAGFTLVNHAVQIFTVIAIGLISAVVTGVRFWKIKLPDKSK